MTSNDLRMTYTNFHMTSNDLLTPETTTTTQQQKLEGCVTLMQPQKGVTRGYMSIMGTLFRHTLPTQ